MLIKGPLKEIPVVLPFYSCYQVSEWIPIDHEDAFLILGRPFNIVRSSSLQCYHLVDLSVLKGAQNLVDLVQSMLYLQY
jgi:hypothetical protein